MLATASSNITVWWCECVAGACCLILSYAISNLKPVLCSAAYKINPRAWGELAGTRWGALPWESNAGANHFCFSSGSPDSIRWQGRCPMLHLLFEPPQRHSPSETPQEESWAAFHQSVKGAADRRDTQEVTSDALTRLGGVPPDLVI